MTDPNTHINYSFADIERYLNGGMTAKEMHDLERAALQHPFLADAIEGYHSADRTIASQHLNEIAAALQKEEPAQVIVMPKKNRFGWVVAASLLAVIVTGVFLLMRQDKSSAPLASNQLNNTSQTDSSFYDLHPKIPKPDSSPAAAPENLALSKTEHKEDVARSITPLKKKASPDKDSPDEAAAKPEEAPQVAMAYAPPLGDEKQVTAQPAPALRDTVAQATGSLSEVVVTRTARKQDKQKGYFPNTWTTDKGKPFLLSEVEVINIGTRDRKKSDTSAIKPEGGWQAFQDYLFSRLSRNDSLALVSGNTLLPDGVELEFSVDKTGSPYNVKVLRVQDSIFTGKIIHAIQTGPKWKSADSKEKRLRLRY